VIPDCHARVSENGKSILPEVLDLSDLTQWRMSMRRQVAISAWMLLVFLTGNLSAQDTTAALLVSTLDETGTPLPETKVTITEVNQSRVIEFTTDHFGRLTATLLPGDYELKIESAGFSPLTVTAVSVHSGDRLQYDAVLTRGAEEALTAFPLDAQLVQPTSAVQTLFGVPELEELPLIDRNFVQLAKLVPGVSSDPGDELEPVLYQFGSTGRVNLSVNGSRRSDVQWLVDGASIVDVFNNSTFFTIPSLEVLREMRVVTSGQGSQAPRGAGGTANVVTKSGTRRYSGSIYEFFRNDKLNANSFFRNASSDALTRERPPRLRYNNFGYTVGGPWKPGGENLFFFFSQEWRRISQERLTDFIPVPDPAWLTDPSNPNYVAPSERDPNAVKLLQAFPAPNVVGRNFFQRTDADQTNTQEEIVHLDYQPHSRWQLTGRYTHALGERALIPVILPQHEPGNVNLPTHQAVVQLDSFLGPGFNQFFFRFSENNVIQKDPKGTKTTRQAYGIEIPELIPGNRGGLIPTVTIAGLELGDLVVSRDQTYRYRYHTVGDGFVISSGTHTFQTGLLFTFEQKDANFAGGSTQGTFNFRAGGGFTGFQNFLRGNRDGRCASPCTYYEDALDVRSQLRFNTYEGYVQDIWRFRPNLTLNFGVRYSIETPVRDKDDLLLTFSPQAFDPAQVPTFSDAFGSSTVLGTGNPLNGWIVARKNSPYGRHIYAWDKNNVQPRVGFAWDPQRNGGTIVRGAYDVYFSPPLVSIFMQNLQSSFPSPLQRRIDVANASLSNPSSGTVVPATARPVGPQYATSDQFVTPRVQQWNLGIQRMLYSRGFIDIGYVGSRGDHLIRPVDINQPQPQDVGPGRPANLVRPFKGYSNIYMRETTAHSFYHGLLASFRHSGRRGGTLVLNYTLSRNKTDATFDNNTIFYEAPHFQPELPQNPLDKTAEFGAAQTDRTHILSAYYIYQLPFFRTSGTAALKALLGGWQVAGITTAASGPAARLRYGLTGRPNEVGGPGVGDQTGLRWFDPGAFTPPAPGTYGTAPVAPLRLPGYYQWDISLAKNVYLAEARRFQLRADLVNAFNQTQFRDINVSCAGVNSCTQFNPQFGTVITTRAPRDIQLGLRLYW
jgi:Carboxypeptidase regulatory-like domain